MFLPPRIRLDRLRPSSKVVTFATGCTTSNRNESSEGADAKGITGQKVERDLVAVY